MKQRIQKVLAHAGVASRRHIEQMLKIGRISVNGKVVDQLGTHVDMDTDLVAVDGKPCLLSKDLQEEKVYFLLYKPAGVLSTTRSDCDRQTVLDLVHGSSGTRIYPVGRLDYDAEGVLLLTNDGDLTNRLIHPKHKIPKVYHVKVSGTPKPADLDKLRRGIYLEDGPTGPNQIQVLGKARVNTWLEVILTQGKNRQIKRMFWRIQNPVMRIVRTQFAGLTVDGLRPGQYRSLTKRELSFLKNKTL